MSIPTIAKHFRPENHKQLWDSFLSGWGTRPPTIKPIVEGYRLKPLYHWVYDEIWYEYLCIGGTPFCLKGGELVLHRTALWFFSDKADYIRRLFQPDGVWIKDPIRCQNQPDSGWLIRNRDADKYTGEVPIGARDGFRHGDAIVWIDEQGVPMVVTR